MSPATLPASAYDALELKPETVQRLITQRRGASPSSIASPNLLQHNLDQQQPECRPQLNESCIFLYAEVLLHIRTVTLFASLHTCHNRETKVELTANGRSITVTHEGESATLRLPIKVEGGGDAALSLPAQPPNKELTLRLQIQEKDDSDLLAPLQSEERKTNIVPWDGAFMSALENAIICCANCHQEVVPAGKIRVWRDLPNENWAEMMDFWHCHKPDEHHLHDHIQRDAIGRKGYAAGNILRTVAGTGYVDLGSFLLKEHDCRGIKALGSSLHCNQCGHILGMPDSASDSWRIWKWCVGVSHMLLSSPITYPIQKWLSARLLFLIDNQGLRKFHIHPNVELSPMESIPSLLIWVFTPDLFFSSSWLPEDRDAPARSMKIFYRYQAYALPTPGEPENVLVDEETFPSELFEELKKSLEESQKILPLNARMFQGWKVGLLERFDFGDIQNNDSGGRANNKEIVEHMLAQTSSPDSNRNQKNL